MNNFSVYLSINPKECKIENNKILIKKRLINPLNLRNYYVALHDFAASIKNKSRNKSFIRIKGLPDLFEGLTIDEIADVNIPINFNDDTEYLINQRINNYLRAYAYNLIELLYVKADRINYTLKEDKLFVVSHKSNSNELMLIVCTDNSLVYKLVSYDILDAEISKIKAKYKITKTIVARANETATSEDIFEGHFDDYIAYHERLAQKFDALNQHAILIPKIKFEYKNHSLTLIDTTDKLKFLCNHKNYEMSPHLYEAIFFPNKTVSYLMLQNNAIIIESDLTQPQYFNDKTCNIIKVLNYGENIYRSNITNYYKVDKSYITTINITISLLNNSINITELLNDYIFINLHFKRKNELE